ncbi:DUF5803 family protein [Halorussus halobius]|uniref:DUF5803 family protein n=1 Tax=Halorussus halobius TaxID=1710537 RepID=UPI0010931487|nr:DUF5803 family protein [Halorussus halobius]
MNRRLLLAVASLALLSLTAGCMGMFGPGEISDEQLTGDENATYDWDTTADVHLNVTSGEYVATYDFTNRSELAVHQRQSFGEEGPVEVGTVRFRYPNGTVVALGQERVHRQDDQTLFELPAEDGTLAYTAPHRGKTFTTPVYVEGSYEVVLPDGMRVGAPILSQVRPNADDRELRDGRTHLRWGSVTSDSLVVRFYLARDLTIFGGVVAAALVVGLVGLGYVRLQIRELERRREEMGLDVDTGDDEFDQGPPPGMG